MHFQTPSQLYQVDWNSKPNFGQRASKRKISVIWNDPDLFEIFELILVINGFFGIKKNHQSM